ncbi:hypothetical protein [Sphingosinicella sp. CPCC 101087]|uniref:hypothetical protein n=1 Tax=Sphingosinicella sp. CPCC 101087 TaxID=2497754 RepID=UPI00101D6D64|nr:hypothetical protein [Sphingosinicella sp. CPCC 101087]
MRIRHLLALPLLLAAAPALATGGFECRTTDGANITIGGTVGHTLTSPLVGARLQLGDRLLATTKKAPDLAIGRSWIDDREIRVNLVDPNATRFEAQLRARIGSPGAAAGTLVRHGATHPVRCELE